MVKVILDKGDGGVRVWEHSTDWEAKRRATALAKLHSVLVVVDRDGDYYVDASDYYDG